jgi:uncharacterized protein
MTTNRRLLSAQEQINVRGILHRAQIAYLGLADDEPYVVPISFAYDFTEDDEGWGRLLLHSGEGRKSRALANNSLVCLSIVSEADFQKGSEVCDDGFCYRSVLVHGHAVLLDDDVQRLQALRMIVAKYNPQSVGRPFDNEALARTLVYSIAIDAVSYKVRERIRC